MSVYNVDQLREMLTRHDPIVAVEVDDSTSYVRPPIAFMSFNTAIERYDPFQQEQTQ